MVNDRYKLEVIACTVEDAVNAEAAGANRLEVIRDFDAGGFTPSLDLVERIANAVSIPIRVMIREEPGYGLTEIISVQRMCAIACHLNRMKIDGLVLGFLSRGDVDSALTRKILACAPDLNATFHHAFEDTIDRFDAIRSIGEIAQIDRILSHGGKGSPDDRIENLAAYARAAEPNIEILAGGRIDIRMIARLRHETDICEFHVGSAARMGNTVSVDRVSGLVEAMRGVYV